MKPTLLASCSGDGTVTSVLPLLAKNLGYRPHNLMGRSIYELLNETGGEAVKGLLADAATPSLSRCELFLKARSGRDVRVEAEVKKSIDKANGKVLKVKFIGEL